MWHSHSLNFTICDILFASVVSAAFPKWNQLFKGKNLFCRRQCFCLRFDPTWEAKIKTDELLPLKVNSFTINNVSFAETAHKQQFTV